MPEEGTRTALRALASFEPSVKADKIALDKTYTNVARVGNSGSASLAVALSEAVQNGLLHRGDKVVLAGVGAGFNFAASVWTWTLGAPR